MIKRFLRWLMGDYLEIHPAFEDVIETNLVDVNEYTPPKLDDSQVMALREMFASDGWKVMTNTLWGYIMKQIILKALIIDKDQRYYQGVFQGFKQATDLAHQFTTPNRLTEMEQFMKDHEAGEMYDWTN